MAHVATVALGWDEAHLSSGFCQLLFDLFNSNSEFDPIQLETSSNFGI
jgi:hypothetical protein